MDPSLSPDVVVGAVIGADGLTGPPSAVIDPLLRSYYDTEWEGNADP